MLNPFIYRTEPYEVSDSTTILFQQLATFDSVSKLEINEEEMRRVLEAADVECSAEGFIVRDLNENDDEERDEFFDDDIFDSL